MLAFCTVASRRFHRYWEVVLVSCQEGHASWMGYGIVWCIKVQLTLLFLVLATFGQVASNQICRSEFAEELASSDLDKH